MAYIIVPEAELYHHGVRGQRWGVRRYQNADGSLTNAGKRRYGTAENFQMVQDVKKSMKSESARRKVDANIQKELTKYRKKVGIKDETEDDETSSKSKAKPKSISEMTDDEIRARISRVQLENQLKSLEPEQVSKGRALAESMLNDAVLPAAKQVVKDVGSKVVTKFLEDKLGLNAKSVKDTLQEEFDVLKIKKDIADIKLKRKEPTKDALQKEYDVLKLQKDIDDLKKGKSDRQRETEALKEETDYLTAKKNRDAASRPDNDYGISDDVMAGAKRWSEYSSYLSKSATAKANIAQRNNSSIQTSTAVKNYKKQHPDTEMTDSEIEEMLKGN